MKALKTSDLLAALRVVSAAGLREELKPVLLKASKEGEKDLKDIGVDALLALLDGVAKKGTESALYEFLARPWEMSVEEIADLDFKSLVAKFKEMGEVNDLSDFFEQLARLTTKK